MPDVFADPKDTLVFERVFAAKEREDVAIGFLNAALELDEAHRIVEAEVALLPAHQADRINPHARARVRDARGTSYAVLLEVRCHHGLGLGNDFAEGASLVPLAPSPPRQGDGLGVTVCDYVIWPVQDRPAVLSSWCFRGPDREMRQVYLELPKLDTRRQPRTPIEWWAYFFREAGGLEAAPAALLDPAILKAFEGARLAGFSDETRVAHVRASAESQAREASWRLCVQGVVDLMRTALRGVLAERSLALSPAEDARIEACDDLPTIERWSQRACVVTSAGEALK